MNWATQAEHHRAAADGRCAAGEFDSWESALSSNPRERRLRTDARELQEQAAEQREVLDRMERQLP